MLDIDNLQKLIHKEILLGRSPSEAFLNIAAHEFNDESRPIETVNRYFNILKVGEENLKKQLILAPKFVQLLVEIEREFERAKQGKIAQKCEAQKCKIQMLSERYAVD
jgi:hypothetical protein